MTDLLLKRLAPLLLHPLSVLAGLVLGGIYGWIDRGQTPAIDLAGDLYLRLLQMCVIPLVFTAVVTSLGKIFASGTASKYLARLVLIVIVGLLLSAGLGILIGLWGAPGAEINQDARQVIGGAVFRAEAMAAPSGGDGSQTLLDIALGIVPENIFVALSTGNMLAILFFAILFGVALGSIDPEKSERAIATFESFYETFITIISWMMYALPFGLFCLAYGQLESIGLPVLVALAKFVAYIYLGCIILVALSLVVIWLSVGGSFWAPLRSQREALFIAFGTASGLATLPAAMRGLKDGLKIDRKVVDLVMPLGITLNPPGSVFHFAIATVFLANLYGMDLDMGQLAFVLVASCLAGMAATGAPGIAALSCMSLILVPLGLPLEVAIILLAAVDPIIDPAVTMVSVQANSASAAILGRSTQDEEVEVELDAVPAE